MKDLTLLEKKINYHFQNPALLELALTHSSYSNEQKLGKHINNERLEFLGDAVLEIIISEYIYTAFPLMPEGDLTKLRASIVCEQSLATIARALFLGDYIYLGKGEENSGGKNRDSLLSDALEALMGAMYLDANLTSCAQFILPYLKNEILKHKNKNYIFDPKTKLQEWMQKYSKDVLEYEIITEKGPDHDKRFEAQVHINKQVIGFGSGRSKKEAEQNAALMALSQQEILEKTLQLPKNE